MTTLSIIFSTGILLGFASAPGYGGANGYQSFLSEDRTNKPWTDTRVSLHKPFRDLEDEEFDTSDGSIVPDSDIQDNIFPDDSSESDSSSDDDFINSPPFLNSMSSEDQEVRRALDLHSRNKSKSSDHPKKKENDNEDKTKAQQSPQKPKPKQKPEKTKDTGTQEKKNEEKKDQNGKKSFHNPSAKKSPVKPKVKAQINKANTLRKNQSTGNDDIKEEENKLKRNPGKVLKGRVVVRWNEETRNEFQPSVKSQLLLFFARLRKNIADIEPALQYSGGDSSNSTAENKKVVFNVMIAHPKNLLSMERDLITDENSSERADLQFSGNAREIYAPEEESEESSEEMMPRQDKRTGRLKKTNDDSSGNEEADEGIDIKHAAGLKHGRHEESKNWLKSHRGRPKLLDRTEKRGRKLRQHQIGLEREIEKELAHGAKRSSRKKGSKQSSGGRHVPTMDQLIAAFDGALPRNQSETVDTDNSREDVNNPVKAHSSGRHEPRRRKKNRTRNSLRNHEHF